MHGTAEHQSSTMQRTKPNRSIGIGISCPRSRPARRCIARIGETRAQNQAERRCRDRRLRIIPPATRHVRIVQRISLMSPTPQIRRPWHSHLCPCMFGRVWTVVQAHPTRTYLLLVLHVSAQPSASTSPRGAKGDREGVESYP